MSYLKALGYKSAFMLVCLFGLFEATTVASSYCLATWASDVNLHNLTTLPAESDDRTYWNIFYLGVYGAIAVVQGKKNIFLF